jgi:hypothetical protein
MTALVRLYAEIALLKRGPQDVPCSMLLLALTVGAYFAINLLINWALPAAGDPWLAVLAIDILFTLGWYVALLRLLHRRERVVQTTTAIFGYRSVLAPLTIGTEWLIRRFGSEQAWQLPLIVGYTAVVVWMIAANSHVLKAAIEWSMFQCVALVVLEIVTSGLIVIALVPLAR